MTVLILYQSVEGQTHKIARFVESQIRTMGQDVDLVDVGNRSAVVSIENADKVILAAPVHERRHPKEFEVFLTANRTDLAKVETMLISVSLSAAFPEGLEEAKEYLTEMEMRTGFSPGVEALVAGAVQSSGYEYFEQQILRHNVLRGKNIDLDGGPREFTDWDALRGELSEFLST